MKISRTGSLKEIMVLKAKVLPYLSCPICNNIFRDATTISECLHTFCEKCITKKLVEDDFCPICEVPLGCAPLEKLRTDHQLREVKRLLLYGRKNPRIATAPPAKRKEKFLSSLIPPSCPPAVACQINKLPSGKRSKSNICQQKSVFGDSRRATRTSNKRGLLQTSNFRDASILKALSKSGGRSVSAVKAFTAISKSNNKATCMEESNIDTEEPSDSDAILVKCHGLGHPPRRLLRKSLRAVSRPFKDISSVVKNCCRISKVASSNACSSENVDGIDSLTTSPSSIRPCAKSRCIDHSVQSATPCTLERKERQVQPNLEKAVSQSSKKRSFSEVPIGKQNCRKYLKRDELTRSGPFKMVEDDQGLNNLARSSLHQRGNSFWFYLQATKNQDMDSALPQISTPFIRIWDGRQPVSAVKKYLAIKLSLKSEKEVEITCQGQPVVPGLPLESVKNIWLATALTGFIPEKEASIADSCRKGSDLSQKCVENNLLIVLNYGRKLSGQNTCGDLALHS